MTSQRSVLIIGAGVSGLIAARTLAEAGCAVTVVEAADCVGGRVRTHHSGVLAIELGAEFVHGHPPELLALLKELGLDTVERDGTMLLFRHGGTLASAEDDGTADPADSPDAFAVMERVKHWCDTQPGRDCSFADWLAEQDLPPESKAKATGFAEGFNAADAHELSVRSLAVQQTAEDAIGGSDGSHIRGGYAQMAERLADRVRAAGGTVRLRAHVSALQWQPGRVIAELVDEERLHAETAVVTLPLGVLQGGSVTITPDPGMVLQHAQRMRMGHVCRVALVFRSRWWAALSHPQGDALQKLSFLIGADRETGDHLHPRFPVFWTTYPEDAAIITAWTGGPHAQDFAALDEHAIAHIACMELARIFSLPREAVLSELVSHHRHDWTRDPLFCGSYSWVPVGAVDASAKMTEPVEDTLFFAGEHTDVTGHWGTVHGAMRSGLRAAQQVLAGMAMPHP